MKLSTIRISNFQCFGENPTEISFENLTFLIGPNGSGKTAAMQALCRIFAFDPSLRRFKKSDFHVPQNETEIPPERKLWIEVDFLFPELLEDEEDHPTIPPQFRHMRFDDVEGVPRIRFRLDAISGDDGDIEETLSYVLEADLDGIPTTTALVSRLERANIHVHYLPARRDPAEHITFSANALIGRLLRAVNWETESEAISTLTGQISDCLATNESINAVSGSLKKAWAQLHKGKYFAAPSITFLASDIDSLLRHLSISFSPGHDEDLVDFSRLSDGQKSMLYLSLVLTSQAIGRDVLSGEDKTFDPIKLRPAVFTIVAIEEPENSLSPHYLGRIVSVLTDLVTHNDAQAVIATHAPSMLRRVDPENIRYLRLNKNRKTKVSQIIMPSVGDEAHKFVREAVQAFPEIYFSRFVILGEGDSEEIVLPRLLKAKGIPVDESAISIAPLGGRHVNHFWRLLTALNIPFVTLLDLDLSRYQGGWGRISYVAKQLKKYKPETIYPSAGTIETMPKWNNAEHKLLEVEDDAKLINYIEELETLGVYFSSPLDLDFAMLEKYQTAYGVETEDKIIPDESEIKAVLGKNYFDESQYLEEEQKLFITYHKRFKLHSKPAAHINALSKLSDVELLATLPESLKRLLDHVIAVLEILPE